MHSLVIQVDERERDLLIADLWEAGATGITEDDRELRAFFDADPVTLLERFAEFHPVLREEEDRDWVRMAQDQWRPFALGDRFYLVPDWLDDQPPEGRLRLRMHPGMACGSGTHAATRLCLLAMEKHIEPGARVLDVGTGAGILADAALLLGANSVFACDIEHESTLVARNNLPPAVGLFTGSARSVKSNAVNWAVCNLNAATLATLHSELPRIAGRLILSGFVENEQSKVQKLFGREPVDLLELEGYVCMVL